MYTKKVLQSFVHIRGNVRRAERTLHNVFNGKLGAQDAEREKEEKNTQNENAQHTKNKIRVSPEDRSCTVGKSAKNCNGTTRSRAQRNIGKTWRASGTKS